MHVLAHASIVPLALFTLAAAGAPRRVPAELSAIPNLDKPEGESLLIIRREGLKEEEQASPVKKAEASPVAKKCWPMVRKACKANPKMPKCAKCKAAPSMQDKKKEQAKPPKKAAEPGKPTMAKMVTTSSASPMVSLKATQLFQAILDKRKAGATCNLAGGGTKYFKVTNEMMQLDCKLWQAAMAHSADMAANNYFSHTSKNGDEPEDRAAKVGAKSSGSEVIAYTDSNDFLAPLDVWLKSHDGHCEAIMNPSNRRFAVEFAKSSSGKKYWTGMDETTTDTTLSQTCKRS